MTWLEPPLPAPDAEQEPFWQPIGRLVFAFGHLEEQIDWCISRMLDAQSTRAAPSVASQIRNICSRIALVEALFRELTSDAKQRTEMHSLIQALRRAITFRNGVLHGPWGSSVDDRRTWHKPRTHPADLSPGSFEVTVAAIDAHIERAAEIGNALVDLVRATAEERSARAAPSP